MSCCPKSSVAVDVDGRRRTAASRCNGDTVESHRLYRNCRIETNRIRVFIVKDTRRHCKYKRVRRLSDRQK